MKKLSSLQQSQREICETMAGNRPIHNRAALITDAKIEFGCELLLIPGHFIQQGYFPKYQYNKENYQTLCETYKAHQLEADAENFPRELEEMLYQLTDILDELISNKASANKIKNIEAMLEHYFHFFKEDLPDLKGALNNPFSPIVTLVHLRSPDVLASLEKIMGATFTSARAYHVELLQDMSSEDKLNQFRNTVQQHLSQKLIAAFAISGGAARKQNMKDTLLSTIGSAGAKATPIAPKLGLPLMLLGYGGGFARDLQENKKFARASNPFLSLSSMDTFCKSCAKVLTVEFQEEILAIGQPVSYAEDVSTLISGLRQYWRQIETGQQLNSPATMGLEIATIIVDDIKSGDLHLAQQSKDIADLTKQVITHICQKDISMPLLKNANKRLRKDWCLTYVDAETRKTIHFDCKTKYASRKENYLRALTAAGASEIHTKTLLKYGLLKRHRVSGDFPQRNLVPFVDAAYTDSKTPRIAKVKGFFK